MLTTMMTMMRLQAAIGLLGLWQQPNQPRSSRPAAQPLGLMMMKVCIGIEGVDQGQERDILRTDALYCTMVT